MCYVEIIPLQHSSEYCPPESPTIQGRNNLPASLLGVPFLYDPCVQKTLLHIIGAPLILVLHNVNFRSADIADLHNLHSSLTV